MTEHFVPCHPFSLYKDLFCFLIFLDIAKISSHFNLNQKFYEQNNNKDNLSLEKIRLFSPKCSNVLFEHLFYLIA